MATTGLNRQSALGQSDGSDDESESGEEVAADTTQALNDKRGGNEDEDDTLKKNTWRGHRPSDKESSLDKRRVDSGVVLVKAQQPTKDEITQKVRVSLSKSRDPGPKHTRLRRSAKGKARAKSRMDMDGY